MSEYLLIYCSMLRDAELFAARLGKLDGAADVGEHVISVVRAKPVISEAPKRVSAEKPAVPLKEEPRPLSDSAQEPPQAIETDANGAT